MKSGNTHQKSKKKKDSSRFDTFRILKIFGVSLLFLSFLFMLLSVGLLFFVQARLSMPVKTVIERQDDAKKHISINGWKRYTNTTIPLTMLIPPNWTEGSIETTEMSSGPSVLLSGKEGNISLSFEAETESTIDCSGGIDSLIKINIENKTVAACYTNHNWHTGEYILIGDSIAYLSQSNNYKKTTVNNHLNASGPIIISANINLTQNSSEEKNNRQIILRTLSTLSFKP